ncbi:voltage-dependent calcium channel subunit alpha-2/delta-3 isoform X2 [Neocloeon triangulifer]|uniref:voltage-dependent calcium channel subunit alpha-2/delta-3 isoform X2 n=1 Tax=Neocloeon triangulifer TaxID=2078957 RepID=UPI00286F0945|nr:voltage-dependent calcium channel subunit alpha-2/delta-3 isoform X2 [Neocloeon triangulifer]
MEATRWLCFVCLLLVGPSAQDEDIPHNEVKNWALKFGVDLWEFGRQFTKMNELQRKYQDFEATVIRKDGLLLIRELAAEVQNMMDIKMNAVLRIMDSAEQAALTKHTSASTTFLDAQRLNAKDNRGANEVKLVAGPAAHFGGLAVNTTLSAVLLPSTVDLKEAESAVAWSELLEPLFVNNYESDPALSWQYFGSSAGFTRLYPAVQWPTEPPDSRSNAWYVGAATSPRDVVILFDASGSMAGEKRSLALATASAILDTLGANDFVNVYRFAENTQEVAPCFKDLLVQANSENVRELKSAMSGVRPENIANFTGALVTAFEILHRYNRTGQGSQCNQAIFLITDGAPSEFKEIFKQYNWPHMPVRVFTYLMAPSGGSGAELNWMACNNKGYFARVSNKKEAKDAALRHVEVLARPLVLYQNNHPLYWSPSFVDVKRQCLAPHPECPRPELMTSVATTIFDRRNYSVRTAQLLGVVGTDVPISEIQKMVPPHKLGVNGYAFMVNNNGHALFHPELRPLPQPPGSRPEYSSVDLALLELVEGEGALYENHSLLNDLRNDLINQKEGEAELTVLVQQDKMLRHKQRRVASRRQKYFYKGIDGTPFTLGIALPEGYGMHEVLAEQEIKLSKVNVTDFFKGADWKVHPDWVYCEYNYANEQPFSTPEDRVLHFLSRTLQPGWKWMSLRPRSPLKDREPGHKKMDRDSYYCDKNLLQSLVFDAMVTESLERPSSRGKENKQQGYQMFGVAMTFVATRSGLMRWKDHSDPIPDQPHFSESNMRSLDEVWYQRAVEQHAVEPDSFVFSVEGESDKGAPLVTASHAVFVEHKGHRAPAAVVGLQFKQTALTSHFINITSTCQGYPNCRKTCASDELDCYVLDNNGFVILSESPEHSGKFFGTLDGTIMDSLVQDRIFKRVPMHDYQGACHDTRTTSTDAAPKLYAPHRHLSAIFQWAGAKALWMLSSLIAPTWSMPIPQEEDDYEDEEIEFPPEPMTPAPPPKPTAPVPMGPARPCEKRSDLYVLQPERLNTSGSFNPLKGKLTNCHVTGCERPFSVQKIPHSNLILLVVDTLCPCGSKQLFITPQEVPPSATCPKESLFRRRPQTCVNYHPEEIEIKVCGSCTALRASLLFCLLTSAWLMVVS